MFSTHPRFRAGSIEWSVFAIGVVAIGLMGVVARFTLPSLGGMFESEAELDFLTTTAMVAPFEHLVLERGEVESSSNVEVRCQVKARSSTGVTIIEIVPEGTRVQKGDFLVRLDDAAFQTQLIQQQIVCSNSEANVIEAKAALEAARLALKEYSDGTYLELLEQQQSEVFVAEENQRRAEEYLRYSERLADKGYIPSQQLEANQFALEKSKKALGVAKTKLKVLSEYTRAKMMNQLEANIETAQARLNSREKTWQLDKYQLADIEKQIELCTINAPTDGQVVYESNRGRSSSSSVLVEEGMPVRERQILINLPDPTKMRVVANVHESRIGFVKEGQTATLRLDANPDLPLTGVVAEVSEYPLPPISVYMAHVKEYEVVIEINDPPLDLRPGMTAETNILVEKSDEALQVPIESVVERNGTFYCAVPMTDGTIETRTIEVGNANETDLVVLSGLAEGDEIILTISDEDVFEMLDLPESES